MSMIFDDLSKINIFRIVYFVQYRFNRENFIAWNLCLHRGQDSLTD
jgi:hypothetical protein